MTFTIRDWATPMVAGAFLLSAVTGVLIFFHLDSGLNKEAHEWLGWALIFGAGAHVFSNFTALQKRFGKTSFRVIVGSFATLLLLSFLPLGEENGGNPMRVGVDRLMTAPLSAVSAVAQKDEEAMLAALKAQGIAVKAATQSIRDLSKGDRETEMRIMRIVFQ